MRAREAELLQVRGTLQPHVDSGAPCHFSVLEALFCNVARPTLLQLVVELRGALAAAAEKVDELEEREKETATAHKKEVCSEIIL
jgi:hypothetical protein